MLTKMAGSALAGLLFVTAVFTTMLDLTVLWRNIWLGFCLIFFVLAVAGVFILCGSHLSTPNQTLRNQTNSERSTLDEWNSWWLPVPCCGLRYFSCLGDPGAPGTSRTGG